MAALPIIMDCDPGQDDALALLLALASPDELDVRGITTLSGNVPLSLTQRNARIICELAGRPDMKVFAGCDRPMVNDLITAEVVHGGTGINGIDVYEPAMPLQEQHGVDFIIETCMAAGAHEITLVPTGPLTNIAMALVKEPRIVEKIDRIVLMGGAMREGGNFSASAEFNILVDPHAAHVVFKCGRPIVAMSLDVTHQVLTNAERLARIKALGTPVATAAHDMLAFFERFDVAKYGSVGAPLHDPCTIAYLLKPDLFETKLCNVEVDIHSPLTQGHTAVDFWHITDRPKNCHWATHVDVEGFYDLLIKRLGRY